MSLSEFFPNNRSIPEGYSFMVLKTYFDAGNKDDSKQYDHLCLAAVCGTQLEWEPFEVDWVKVLDAHHANYLHVTDAVTGNGIYEGWTDTKIKDFLRDCVGVAQKHLIRSDRHGNIAQFGLFPYVASVVLKDYMDARSVCPDMPINANEPIFRMALTASLLWGRDQAGADEYQMVFDRGEPFYGYLCNLLESKKAKSEALALSMISSHTQAKMICVPALQLADLFAWGISHKLQSEKQEWHEELLRLDIGEDWRDSTNIFDVHRDAHAWKAWNIPKRRATK
jgi:hypothetical protein